MRRVVVTGLGIVSPLGVGVRVVWSRLFKGESGIRQLNLEDIETYPVRIGGQVPRGSGEGEFDLDQVVPGKEQKKMDPFIHFALKATEEALKDANWAPQTDEDQWQTGVLIGAGIGGLPGIHTTASTLDGQGHRRVSPFFIPSTLINLAAGQVSIRHGLKGPNHAVVTACATGTHAIGDAARLIMFGDADVMVAGGAEAALCHLGLAGFSSARALASSFNDRPTEASRPWDAEREGFVMGEGAGILILEELEHAKRRGAKIYGEVLGYGLSGDAFHVTAPSGEGAERAMKAALRNAGVSPDQIDYINAHGTSTPPGDAMEVEAVKRTFGDHASKLAMSSTKSAIGHLLGAAGGVEAIFTLMAMKDSILPPTLNLHNPCEEAAGVNLVPLTAQEKPVHITMSNSFGFGGTNASVIFGKVD